MEQGIRLQIAIGQIKFARLYTISLIDEIDPADWFRQPTDGVSHVAWQVGHLAMAEYALTMMRVRGKEPEDAQLISNDFFRTFKKGSTPVANPSTYPPVAEIRGVFDRVHERALAELSGYTEDELQQTLPEPHALFDTKLGSVYFCSAHEMLHAGQIGLLRRLLGMEPIR